MKEEDVPKWAIGVKSHIRTATEMKGEIMKIKAKYDQIVGWRNGQGNPGDSDYVPQGPDTRCYHYVFGKPGSPVSGGLYIKINEMAELPKEIILKLQPIDGQLEQEKWREKHGKTEEVKAQEGVSG